MEDGRPRLSLGSEIGKGTNSEVAEKLARAGSSVEERPFRAASRQKCVRALAPVVASSGQFEVFRNLFSRAAKTPKTSRFSA